MNHLFLSHTLTQLLDLKTDLRATLKNPRCYVLTSPVLDTLKQIDKEFELRGIKPVREMQNLVMKINVTV